VAAANRAAREPTPGQFAAKPTLLLAANKDAAYSSFCPGTESSDSHHDELGDGRKPYYHGDHYVPGCTAIKQAWQTDLIGRQERSCCCHRQALSQEAQVETAVALRVLCSCGHQVCDEVIMVMIHIVLCHDARATQWHESRQCIHYMPNCYILHFENCQHCHFLQRCSSLSNVMELAKLDGAWIKQNKRLCQRVMLLETFP